MKLLGIEFGGSKPVVNQHERVESDFIEVRSGSRIQKVRQGARLVQITEKATIIEKNRVNIDTYNGLTDY